MNNHGTRITCVCCVEQSAVNIFDWTAQNVV